MPRRDRLVLDLSPADRESLNALLDAIQPGLRAERGSETNAALRMFRLGMAIYAGQPSMRHALPPTSGHLIELVLKAKARDAAVGAKAVEEAQPAVAAPVVEEKKRKKA